MTEQRQRLYRDGEGRIKDMLSTYEGYSFKEDPFYVFLGLARYKFVVRFLKRTDRVLDAGCGLGLGAVLLSQFAGHVTAADIDGDFIEANAKEYSDLPNLDFIQLNLLDIPPSSPTYDAVVSLDVIEHFDKRQIEVVAANYAALVRDGGFAVIGTPNIASRPFASQLRLDSHLHEFEHDEFEQLLSKYFKRVFLFSMTDEIVSTAFPKLAWYLMALCVK